MKMKSKLNQNIGMSVSIAVVNTVQKQSRIKNKMKSLIRKIEIENEVMEKKSNMKLKLKQILA